MTFAVAVEHWRRSYTINVPSGYDEDYLTITTTAGATVTHNGETLTGFTTIEGTNYVTRWLLVDDGLQTLVGDAPLGVDLHGYDCGIGYAMPAGLNITSGP